MENSDVRDGFGNGNRRREESRSDVTRDVFESFMEVGPLGAPAWGGVVSVCWAGKSDRNICARQIEFRAAISRARAPADAREAAFARAFPGGDFAGVSPRGSGKARATARSDQITTKIARGIAHVAALRCARARARVRACARVCVCVCA